MQDVSTYIWVSTCKRKGEEAGWGTGEAQVWGHLAKPPTLVGSSGGELPAESSCGGLNRPGVHTPSPQSLDGGPRGGRGCGWGSSLWTLRGPRAAAEVYWTLCLWEACVSLKGDLGGNSLGLLKWNMQCQHFKMCEFPELYSKQPFKSKCALTITLTHNTMSELINLAKLKDAKSTHKNQLHFYEFTISYH